jgi:ribosomal-protein-alanine N-acetyltransferase
VSVQAARLADLHKAAFPDAAWSLADFTTFLSDPTVTVISRDHGLAVIRTVLDEAELLTLGVVPSCQRSGVGSQLLAEALDAAQARGALRLYLEVAVDNMAARALYARAGFVQVGTRRAYYPRPGLPAADAVLLQRALA